MTTDRPYTDLFIDFDDTLCDTHGNAQAALCELFAHFHLERHFDAAQRFYDAYWRANIELWRDYAAGRIDRSYLIVERFRRPLSVGRGLAVSEPLCLEMSDYFLDRCAEQTGVVEGAHELVDHLRRRGYRLHLCSNGFHEVQYRKIRSCGFEGCFDSIVLSEDAGANKPAAAFFDYAFRRSQARRPTTLMIGDSWDSDMRGALDYGLPTMFFNRFPEFPPPQPVDYEIHALAEAIAIL